MNARIDILSHNALAGRYKSENYMMTYNSGMADKIKYVTHVRQCQMIVEVYVRQFPFELSAFHVVLHLINSVSKRNCVNNVDSTFSL